MPTPTLPRSTLTRMGTTPLGGPTLVETPSEPDGAGGFGVCDGLGLKGGSSRAGGTPPPPLRTRSAATSGRRRFTAPSAGQRLDGDHSPTDLRGLALPGDLTGRGLAARGHVRSCLVNDALWTAIDGVQVACGRALRQSLRARSCVLRGGVRMRMFSFRARPCRWSAHPTSG